MENINIAQIRNSLESFTEEMSREYYLYGAGHKPVLNLEGIYSKYPGLFTSESISSIKDALFNCGNNTEKKRLKMLLEAVYGETFSQNVKFIREEISGIESSGNIATPNGETISFINSYSILCNDDSRERREEISAARSKFIDEKINPLLMKIFTEEEAFIKSMGFENKAVMFEELTGINLNQLNSVMRELIDKTDESYERLIDYFSTKKLGNGITGLRRHDIIYLTRGHEYDSIFPANKMTEVVSDFTKKAGIDINGQGKINFDTEKRDTKSPRAFCSPVKIPKEIYLVINPQGGINDYSSFLHELGHALHFAHVDGNLELEYRWFGDNSVTEGFAMTFDHLLLDKRWLSSFIQPKSERLNDYLKFACFKELVMLRRYAAKLEYEIKLNDGRGLEGKKDIFIETFEGLTKIKYDKAEFLNDVDPLFYCARYLRAWMLQSSLHSYFTGEFGSDWFLSNSTGEILKEMWSFGQKYSADELLSKYGLGELSVTPILDNIYNLLN